MNQDELSKRMKNVKKGDKFEIATDGGEAVVLTADEDASYTVSYVYVYALGVYWSGSNPHITHFEVVAPRPSWEGHPVVQDAYGELWKYDGALYDSRFWKGYSASMVEAEHGPCKPLFTGDELLLPILEAVYQDQRPHFGDAESFMASLTGLSVADRIKAVLGVDHD